MLHSGLEVRYHEKLHEECPLSDIDQSSKATERILEDSTYFGKASWTFRSSVYPVENRHGLHKKYGKTDDHFKAFGQVVACCVNDQVKTAAEDAKASVQQASESEALVAMETNVAEEAASAVGFKPFQKKKTPEQLHRYDWRKEQKARDPNSLICAWRIAWEECSLEKKKRITSSLRREPRTRTLLRRLSATVVWLAR